MSYYLGFEPTQRKHYFFVSYKRIDGNRIAPIVTELDRFGIPLWYDQDIGSGAEWEGVLSERIRGCLGVLLFVTRNTFEKTDAGVNYVQLEYKVAKRFGKEIIPVFLERVDAGRIPAEYSFWYEDLTGIQGITVPGIYEGVGQTGGADHVDAAERADEEAVRLIRERLEKFYYNASATAVRPEGDREAFGREEEKRESPLEVLDFKAWKTRKEKKHRNILILVVIVICVILLAAVIAIAAGRRRGIPNADTSTENASGLLTVDETIPAEGDTADTSASIEASDAAVNSSTGDDSTTGSSAVILDSGDGISQPAAPSDGSGASDGNGQNDGQQGNGSADTGNSGSGNSGSGNGTSSDKGNSGSTDSGSGISDAGDGGSSDNGTSDAGNSGGSASDAGNSGSGASDAGNGGSSDSGNGASDANGTSGTGNSGSSDSGSSASDSGNDGATETANRN